MKLQLDWLAKSNKLRMAALDFNKIFGHVNFKH